MVIDVKGVKTRSLVDGLSRPVYEERQDADNPLRAAQYRQTWSARYTDVLQQVQTYTYDTAGRLEHTRLGTTSSSFTFDSLGQSSTINTQDSASGQQVTITLEHDGLGRETKRTFDLDGVEQDLNQVYNEVDLLVRRTLRTGGTLLRDETYDYDPRGRLVLYQCQGSQPPVDPYGKAIVSQLFRFDVIDNLIRVTTTYRSTGDTNSTNIAVYSYTGVDPAQLTKVTNSASGDGYPAVIELAYNADGHMTRDEENRVLEYDTLGRLIHVSASPGGESGTYNYDPLDTLSGLDDGDGAERRFYRDGELANQIKGANSSTFMRGDGVVLVEHQAGADPKSLMLVSDASSSLISEVANGGVNSINYTAYGHRTGEHPVNSQVGYNGEVKELKTNCYMLGNGYRQFSPSLMVFFSPDSLSPFGVGGINAYAYCEGDPINNVDETGHMPRRVSFVPAQAAPLRPIDARFEAIAENLKFNRRAEVSPSQAARSRLTRDIALLTPGTAESAVRVRRRAPSPAPQEPPPDYDSDTGPAAVKSISSRRAKSDPVVPGASGSTVEARPAKSGRPSSARTHVPKPRELTEKEREKALSARIEEIRALHGKRL
ncbi:RHS repeat-associated core domain-containing protein [Rhodococcus sp. IEGM1300]